MLVYVKSDNFVDYKNIKGWGEDIYPIIHSNFESFFQKKLSETKWQRYMGLMYESYIIAFRNKIPVISETFILN